MEAVAGVAAGDVSGSAREGDLSGQPAEWTIDAATLESLRGRCHVTRSGRHASLVLLKCMHSCRGAKDLTASCKGLILDEDNSFRPVAFPYRAFFNAGEKAASTLDWRTVRVYEKLDGTLMTLYWYAGDWNVATSGHPDALSAVEEHAPEGALTFRELFWDTWKREGFRLPDEKHLCFMFELQSPENRVVVPVEAKRLTLHGARDMLTLQELRPEPLAEKYGWRCCKPLPGESWSLEAVKELAERMSCVDGEGFVVVDQHFERLKVKSKRYVLAAHLPRPNWGWRDGLNVEKHSADIVALVLRGEGREFCSYFPEWAASLKAWEQRLRALAELLESMPQDTTEPDAAQPRLSQFTKRILSAKRSGQAASCWEALAAAAPKEVVKLCTQLAPPPSAVEAAEGPGQAPPADGAKAPCEPPTACTRHAEAPVGHAAPVASSVLWFQHLLHRLVSWAPGGVFVACGMLARTGAGYAAAPRPLALRQTFGVGIGALLLGALAATLAEGVAQFARRLRLRHSCSVAVRGRNADGVDDTPEQKAVLCILEALLRRLAACPETREAFVLRGSLLTRQCVMPASRQAQDLDLLSVLPWESWEATRDVVSQKLRRAAGLDFGDGINFDVGEDAVLLENIWAETQSPGVRVELPALFFGRRRTIQIDVAFNDPLEPPAAWLDYQPLAGERFRVLSAAPEALFAWKLHGLFEHNEVDDLGRDVQGKWRPKDVHDLYLLVKHCVLDAQKVARGCSVAFASRGQELRLVSRVIRKTFGSSGGSGRKWRNYRQKCPVPDEVPLHLYQVVDILSDYLASALSIPSGSQESERHGRFNLAPVHKLDDAAMVAALPGQAHVFMTNRTVAVTEDLRSHPDLLAPGSTVRFAGRNEEFEVDKVKRAPQKPSSSGVQTGCILILKQTPTFTAKDCPLELITRRVASKQAPAVEGPVQPPAAGGHAATNGATMESKSDWLRQALGLQTLLLSSDEEKSLHSKVGASTDMHLAQRLEVLPPLKPLCYVTNCLPKFEEARRCLAEWQSMLTMADDLLPPVSLRRLGVEKLAAEMARYAHGVLGIACFLDIAYLQLEGEEQPILDLGQAGESAFVDRFEGRKGCMRSVLAFCEDGGHVALFDGALEGQVVAPRGDGPLHNPWDRVWLPDDFPGTLAELETSAFVVSPRHVPFLEMAQTMRGRDYSQIFEIHITVKAPDDDTEPVKRFKEACQALRSTFGQVKPVLIENASGESARQMMTASHHVGSLPDVHILAFRLSQALVRQGYQVVRTKIEANMSNQGVPVSDEEALRLSPENYFEFHIKLSLPPGFDEGHLRAVVKEHDARLSRSALRVTDGGVQKRFVTLRLYSIGRTTAAQRFEDCCAAIEAAGFMIEAKIREYAVYDSNVRLDRGWIDAPAKPATPATPA